MLRLVFVGGQFRIWEVERVVVHIGEAGGMVRVHMGEQHGVDLIRVHARRDDVLQQLARRRLQIVAGPGLNQASTRPLERIMNPFTYVRRPLRKFARSMLKASSGSILRRTSTSPSRKPSEIAVTVISPILR